MKKFYVGAIALACSMVVFAEDVESVLSFSLVNLTKERMNMTHSDSKGNEIKIETNEPSGTGNLGEFLYRTTTDNPLQCVGETPSEILSEYGFVVLKGQKDASNKNSPSIQITLPGNKNITAIQLLGFTAGSGLMRQVLCGFSDNTTADNDYYTNWDDPIAEAGGDPAFMVYSSNCTNKADDNFENKRLVPADAKYVKLIVSKDFTDGGVSAEEMEQSPFIYAIRFFAKDTPTGIEVKKENSFSFDLFDRNLQLNTIADVSIYETTGKLIAQYKDIDNAYLNYLQKGIYIIKASNKEGQQSAQKVVIK